MTIFRFKFCVIKNFEFVNNNRKWYEKFFGWEFNLSFCMPFAVWIRSVNINWRGNIVFNLIYSRSFICVATIVNENSVRCRLRKGTYFVRSTSTPEKERYMIANIPSNILNIFQHNEPSWEVSKFSVTSKLWIRPQVCVSAWLTRATFCGCLNIHYGVFIWIFARIHSFSLQLQIQYIVPGG